MTDAVAAAAPHPSIPAFRRPALMWWPIIFASHEPRLRDLSRAQLLDAGIPLDLARRGRSADVSALAITMLEPRHSRFAVSQDRTVRYGTHFD